MDRSLKPPQYSSSSSSKRQKIDESVAASKSILEYIEQVEQQQQQMEVIHTQEDFKRLILKLEKSYLLNTEERTKYTLIPEKFFASENDLHESISALIHACPSHMLHELVQLGTLDTLFSLLEHENADISAAVIELFEEITELDDEDDEGEDERRMIKEFLHSFTAKGGISLLFGYLEKFKESEEEEYEIIFKVLSVIENIIRIDESLTQKICDQVPILQWIVKQLKIKTFGSNKLYATELLVIFLQYSVSNRRKFSRETSDGIHVLLESLAAFRKKDPKDADEIEFLENLFDALCAALLDVDAQAKFIVDEGIELMILFIQERKYAMIRAVKTLSFCLDDLESAKRFVSAFGLKFIFPEWMGRAREEYKRKYKEFKEDDSDEHSTSIIASLFKTFSLNEANDEDVEMGRLLIKFVEAEGEKIDRLAVLMSQYATRDNKIKASLHNSLSEEDQYMERLDNGLFTLQNLALIAAFLCMLGDDEIISMVEAKIDLALVKDLLTEYETYFAEEDEKDSTLRILKKLIALFN